jgi:hypothetical protein
MHLIPSRRHATASAWLAAILIAGTATIAGAAPMPEQHLEHGEGTPRVPAPW